ncbi:ATP-binding response regulator [Chondromyces apiculatus]|nr:ATP-binding protein [Chondromyces apiculatus]
MNPPPSSADDAAEAAEGTARQSGGGGGSGASTGSAGPRALSRAGISRDEKTRAQARHWLLTICTRHRNELLNDWLENVLALPPGRTRFADRPVAEVMDTIRACLSAFTEILEAGGELLLEALVSELVEQRLSGGTAVGSPLLVASQFRAAVAGVLDTMHVGTQDEPLPPTLDVLLASDELVLQFEHHFAEAYTRRALLESEERYRDIFELATDVLATVDKSGRLTQINGRIEPLLGRPAESWIGRMLEELATPADAPALRDAVTAALSGVARQEVTTRCPARDGSTRKMSVRLSPLSGGEALLVVMRDITDEVARRAQILLGEKLASIGQVAASVAHELNNPLAWVMANLEQIRMASVHLLAVGCRLEFDAELLREAESIDTACHEALAGVERMRDIVTDLNVFSSSNERRPERLDLVDVIELALRMTGPQLSQLCRIERAYGDMPPLVGFPGRLSQVFVNLFLNAAQAMPRRPRDENVVRVTTRYEGGIHEAEVEDNGRGMTAEVLEHIFDPFFTTKEQSTRAGIGLWVSRKILEEQRGTMVATSTPEVGTCFTIRIMGLDPEEIPMPRPLPEPPPPASRSTVLFVDDEPMLLSAFARGFEGQHEVLVASSGEAALELLSKRGGQIDAIICDLLMPQMSGMDLYDAVSERYPHLRSRMAFMSGGAFTERAREFVERVPNPKIAKPIALNDLERAIADLLQQSGESAPEGDAPSKDGDPSEGDDPVGATAPVGR